MSRKATIALLALALLFAGAMSAASAQAGAEFLTWKTAESEEGFEEEVPVPSTVDAAQTVSGPLKFTLLTQSVTCTTATASGTLASGASPTLTLTPSYSGCVMSSTGSPVDVSIGSCAFVLHLGEELEPGAFKATTDLTCGGGSELKFTVTSSPGTKLCTYRVPAQSGLSTVIVSNMSEASPNDITLKNELAEVKVEREGSILCGKPSGTGQLTGTTTATATGEGETVPPIKVAFKKFHFAFEKTEPFIEMDQDTGSQEFGLDLGTVKCAQAHFEGGIFGGVTSSSVLPAGGGYGGCKFKIEAPEIEMNGCVYRYTARAIEFGAFLGRTKIECAAGNEIEVPILGCIVKIPSQIGPGGEGIGQVIYTEVGSGESGELTASVTIGALRYEEEGGGCTGTGPTKGTFNGTLLIKAGVMNGNQFGLSIGKT